MSLGSTRNVRDHSLHKGVSRYTSQGNVWLTSPISAQLPPVVPEYFANLYTKRKGTVTWVRPRQTTDPGQHQKQEDSAAAKVRESGISSTQNKVFRLFFSPVSLPISLGEVKLWLPPTKTFRADGEIPRDINYCLKSLQRTFSSPLLY